MMQVRTPWPWAACLVVMLPLILGCGPTQPGDGREPPDTTDPNAVRNTIVAFQTTPAGASIILDGAPTGEPTPADITNVPSKILGTQHLYSLALDGYYAFTGLVTTYYDRDSTQVQVSLVPDTAAPGQLSIASMPPGAAVSLDGDVTGEVTPVTLEGVAPTGHVLTLTRSGYESRTEAVLLGEGAARQVDLQLAALNTDAVGGTVFDAVTGALVVGATVRILNTTYETTSTVQGTYVFENVPPGDYDIEAVKVLSDGTALYGIIEGIDLAGERVRRVNHNILVGDENAFSTLSGKVTDESGSGVDGAVVSALLVLGDRAIASTLAVTDAAGIYRFSSLPPGTYDVAATASGRDNAALAAMVIAANRDEVLDFELHPIPADATVFPAPELDGDPQAITYPRAEAIVDAAYLAARERIAQRSAPAGGDSRTRALDELRDRRRQPGARGIPPVDSFIEIDVYWFAIGQPDLGGYDIYRSTDETYGFRRAAEVGDPNATFAADISPDVGPQIRYYYDMDAFSTDGSYLSPVSTPGSAVPLDRLVLSGPVDGSTVAGSPTLSWRQVSGAQVYIVMIYDQLPDFDTGSQPVVWESPDLPRETAAINPSDFSNAPTLEPGRTYYWVVVGKDVGGDAVAGALSISPFRTFTVE